MFQFLNRDELTAGFRSWIKSLVRMPSRSVRGCVGLLATLFDVLVRVTVLAQETLRAQGTYSSGVVLPSRTRKLTAKQAAS